MNNNPPDVLSAGPEDRLGSSLNEPPDEKPDSQHGRFRMGAGFFGQVLESLEDYAVFTTDPEGAITSWNAGAVRLLGYTREEAIGQPAGIIFTEEDRRKRIPEQEMQVALEQGRALDERFHCRKDGTLFWASGKVFPLYDEQDNFRGFTKIMRDLSGQHQAQKALSDSEAQFRTLADAIPHLAWMASKDGWIFWYNIRWYEYTGTTPAQMEGWGWQSVHDPAVLPQVMERWSHSIATGRPFDMVFPLKGADGFFRPFLTRVTPVYDGSGEVVQWFGTNTDIYDQQLTQQHLQALNRELADTTKELAAANEELTAANEEITSTIEELASTNLQLTRVNADLDNFIYTASHDLKAPISNIEGLVQALLRQLPAEALAPERVQRTVSLIQGSVDRFRKTIDNLTEVVKLQKENNPESVMVNLPEVIREVMLDLAPVIQSSGAVITTEVADTTEVRFSAKNLRSVVYNLVSNAIKYRFPDRVPLICIDCQTTATHHVLSVSDNGLGMEAGRISQLFTMFRRFHDHVEGTGIGLYMVKKMVENAGGHIVVESQPEQGSQFLVYFRR
jgi:PAS domain S-box-containing protein